MQSQGRKEVGSWRVPRELRWLQESFCSEGVLHEGGELHHESGPEDTGEGKLLRGGVEGSEAGEGRSSLTNTRGKSPRCEGPSNPTRLRGAFTAPTESTQVGGKVQPIIIPDTDAVESEEDSDSSWEEWDGEDSSGEGTSSNSSDGEPHGCTEGL